MAAAAAAADLRKLAQAMCSIDLTESCWTQVSLIIRETILVSPEFTCDKHCLIAIVHFCPSPRPIAQSQELQHLQVPDLWLTVSRYLASLKAVLQPNDEPASEKELKRSGWSAEQLAANRRQYERTDRLVKHFMLNEGPQLQRDLKEYANKCQNWVS